MKPRICLIFCAGLLSMLLPAGATPGADGGMKTNSFDVDPGWEGFNNRVRPEKQTTVTQNFGYSTTNFAGKRAGEAGGTVQRAMTPAYYGAKIDPKSLEDKITASSTFAVTASGGSGGVFFGFFNPDKTGASSRPTNSLGMSMDFQGSGGRIAVYLITASNKVHGNFITPYIPGTYRPTPIKNDGSVRYTWKLNYDPAANKGNGRFVFTIKGDGKLPANFEGKVWTVDIPPELRRDTTTFTHFGMMNLLVDGNQTTLYFDDLTFNGRTESFDKDPGWDSSGNRGTYVEKEPHGAHNFGYTATNGGKRAGEIGGILWRHKSGGHYADSVGPLSLKDRLEARGKVILAVGATDADMRFGWFKAAANTPTEPNEGDARDFVGIHIGGPTRVGHYFLPEIITTEGGRQTSEGTRERPQAGPIMKQKRAYDFTFVYDPSGNGSINATLGEESVVLNLRAGLKDEGANLDRFGMLVVRPGGHHVKVYLDDLTYTTQSGRLQVER